MKRTLLVALLLVAVAACGGGGGAGSSTLPAPGHGGSTPSLSTKESIRVTFPTASASGSSVRRPAFLTPNTASFSLVLYTVNGATPSPQPTPLAIQLTNTQYCTSANGSTTCSVAFNVPVATAVVVEIQTFDASGNLIGGGFVGPIDTTQATIPSQNVTVGGVLASFTFGATALSAGDDGAQHAVTFTVTGKDKDGNTILPPGNYPFPITFNVSSDPAKSLTVPASVTSPGPNGTSTVTLAYNSANALTGVATLTGTSGSASASLTFAPIIFTPTTLQSLLVSGSSATVTVSEPGFAGAFTPSGASSVATVTCAPANCTPASAGGSVTLSVAPGTTAGTETVSISDGHGFANVPITVTSSSGGAPIVGAPNIHEYATAAGGTNYGITVGPDGSSLWFVDRATAGLGVVPNPASCSATCTVSEVANPQPTTPAALQSITSAADGNIYYSGVASGGDSGAVFQATCSAVLGSCTNANFYSEGSIEALIAAPDGYLYAFGVNGSSGVEAASRIQGCCSFGSQGFNPGVGDGVALDPTGQWILWTDSTNQQVGFIPIPCGFCTLIEEPGGSMYGGGLRHRNPLVAGRRRDCACVPPAFSTAINGIVAGPDGNMYVADAGAHDIVQFNAATWIGGGSGCQANAACATTPIALPNASAIPEQLVVGPDGNVWFTDANGSIGVISITSCATSCKAYEYPVGGAPWGIAVGPDGDLWFTDSSTNKIGKVVLQ